MAILGQFWEMLKMTSLTATGTSDFPLPTGVYQRTAIRTVLKNVFVIN